MLECYYIYTFLKDSYLRVLSGLDFVSGNENRNFSEATITKLINTCADRVTNLSFNTKYTSLAISTNRVRFE